MVKISNMDISRLSRKVLQFSLECDLVHSMESLIIYNFSKLSYKINSVTRAYNNDDKTKSIKYSNGYAPFLAGEVDENRLTTVKTPY